MSNSAPSIPESYTNLFEQLQTGVLLLQLPEQSITYLNPACAQLLPAAEYLQTPVQDYLSFPDGVDLLNSTSICGVWKHNAESKKLNFKNNLVTVDATSYLLSFVETASDDTSKLQAHNDFISTVSHEFRTPLTSIKGFADTLLQYGSQLDAEQQRRFIHIIRDQADRLIRLVEAVLEVSKSGVGKFDFSLRPVPLKKLVERITQSIAIKSTVPHPFVMDIPENLPPVWADADRLEQILTNLVDNAVKYSDADKTVTIKAYECCKPYGEAITIEVTDEGIGIPEEHLDKLFHQFYRIENPLTQKVEGTGLGLYITQSLTVAMEGDLSVESAVGKGSTFKITFPVATLERQTAYHRKRYAEDSPTHPGEETAYAG